MSGTLSVGLLFGGESPEHEVSIVTARSIAQHLDPARFEVRPMGIARNGVWAVTGDPFARLAAGELPERSDHPFLPLERGAEATPLPDLFFNALHGAGGEDGQIQGYLELLHRPYTGAGLLAMAAGMDKWITKRLWESDGLPVVPYVGLTEERWHRERRACLDACVGLGQPLFVKPANLGSSIGVEKVKRAEELPSALDRAFTFDRRVLVEQGLDVREIEVAVLGGDEPLVSQPGEVIVADEFYTFEDKYIAGRSRTEIPAQIPEELADLVHKLAARAFAVSDGYGMARVDFFLERTSGRVFLNELNFIPGFTSISMYPKMMAASGVPYAELLTRLIDLALARYAQTAPKQKGFKSGSDWFREVGLKAGCPPADGVTMDAFGSALSGLRAAGAGLAVQANNIANQRSDGYRAKRVDLAAQPAGGVAVQGFPRIPPHRAGGSNVDLATEAVQGMAMDVMYKANLKVVQAEDKRMKATLDLKA